LPDFISFTVCDIVEFGEAHFFGLSTASLRLILLLHKTYLEGTKNNEMSDSFSVIRLTGISHSRWSQGA
jgi:hypothetical protein